MKKLLLLSAVILSFMMNIKAERPSRPAGTGPMSAPLGNSISYRRCIEPVEQASDKLRELREWIVNQKEKAPASKADYAKYNKRIELHVKGILKDVRNLLNRAEKESDELVY